MRFSRNRFFISLSVVFFTMIAGPVRGQAGNIRIRSDNQALNDLLVELRQQYQIRVSFDDQLLSGYRITADTVFADPDEAIQFLISNLPIGLRKTSKSYILYPLSPIVTLEDKKISGRIIDKDTRETLPYSHIWCNDQLIISDQNGNFALRSEFDTLFHLQVSYLGY